MALRSVEGGAQGLVVLLLVVSLACPSHERDRYHSTIRGGKSAAAPGAEGTPGYWVQRAREEIRARLGDGETSSVGTARNVVLFLGDGMSVSTQTAARMLLGQRHNTSGEEARLAFEMFPTMGMTKTYCVDAQVADSACTATAYLGGEKTNVGTIGLSAGATHSDCDGEAQLQYYVRSIAEWALADGRDAGVVTTTRVTHASPAGTYAHVTNRDWESDADVRASCAGKTPSRDIALQLVQDHPGQKFKVILGGGRREFLSHTALDEEGKPGRRMDGKNLIEEWQQDKRARNVSYRYVSDRWQLMNASADLPEYLLGLFESSHMQYHMEADAQKKPTLVELTEVAIRSLSRNKKGFFLFVEGGRIDHAHHENFGHLALDETLELNAAVARSAELLSSTDSLLVVTADHAHVMSISGYSARGADILGPSGSPVVDLWPDANGPYMTLSYANGHNLRFDMDIFRQEIEDKAYRRPRFLYNGMVQMRSATHSGEDVTVFARGPHHRLFTGLYEQSNLPHYMAYAACIGPGLHACSDITRNNHTHTHNT